jgi:protein phosphatase
MSGVPLPAVRHVDLQPGDRLLLCTDGLTRMVSESEIRRVLHARRSPRQVCRRLVSSANTAGGRDNITVVVVSVLSGE